MVSQMNMLLRFLPTLSIFPTLSNEGFIDTDKEDWGVNGYGSMKGIIWIRDNSFKIEAWGNEECSSKIDVDKHVEEHVELE